MTALNLASKKLGVLSMSHCDLSVIPAGISKSIRQLNLAGKRTMYYYKEFLTNAATTDGWNT